MTPRLCLRNVRLRIGDAEILGGVDLSVDAGEWVTIVGPNGAGKSSLLRAIVGLVPSTGTVEICGRLDLKGLERARHVALVPQTPLIPVGVKVVDYVALGRVPHRGPFAAETAAGLERISEHLDRLDLQSLSYRTVTSLSGGERQRVVIARALAQETDVLLLDEPTTALDIGHQQDLLHIVEELRTSTGVAIVVTAHDLTLAGRFGGRLVILDEGRIVADGEPSEVLTAQAIHKYYGADVRIIDDVAGPIVVPLI